MTFRRLGLLQDLSISPGSFHINDLNYSDFSSTEVSGNDVLFFGGGRRTSPKAAGEVPAK